VSVVTPTNLDRLSPRDRLALTAEVIGTYLRVRWSMRGEDAERAVQELRAHAAAGGRRFDSADSEYVAAWRLSRAVRKVLERIPGDSRCLFKSLTLTYMLERRGIAQTLVIAVRPRPFAAHAWVEVEGETVLQGPDPGYERLLEL
jgi:Transglutaminase-like superfamily